MKMKQFLRNGLIWIIAIAMMMGQVVALETVDFTEEGDFSGAIVSEASTNKLPDLSGVEIAVYSILDSHDYDGIIVYDKEYEFSVFTDANGKFSLQKPDGRFELMVKRESLPSGYAVACHTKIFSASDDTGTFTITQGVVSNGQISADDNVQRINQIADFISAGAVYETENVTFSQEGLIVSGNLTKDKSEPFSELFCFSETDPAATINSLYTAGLLNDTQKADQLCNLLEYNMFPEGYCLNPIAADLQDYIKMTENKMLRQEEIETRNRVTDLVASITEIPDLNDYIDSDHFVVHYDDLYNNEELFDTMIELRDYLEDLYELGVNLGFRAPLLNGNSTKIHFYFTSDSYGNANAATWPYGILGNTRAGYVVVYNFTEDYDDLTGLKETLAHEYFHLIEYAYNYATTQGAGEWIMESCAVWFSVKYSGYMDRAMDGDHLEWYIDHSTTTVDYNTYTHGSPLVMAIDITYGGTAVIEEIMYRLSLRLVSPTQNQIRSDITNAIQEYNPGGSFEEAYKYMCRYLTYPEFFYSSILPPYNFAEDPDPWGIVPKDINSTNLEEVSATLNPFGCLIKGYKNGVINNIDRLSISIDFGSGTHNSYAITKEIAQNQYSMTSATTSNSATIIVTNFSSLRSVFVVAMNTDNNADTEVTITLGVA